MPKVICSTCGKNEAQKHPIFGFVACKSCQRKSKFEHHGRSMEHMLNYLATPFWRLMGLKAKPEEVAMEKEMKRRNLSYLDLQKIRAKQAETMRTFDSSDLKNKLYRRELPHGKTIDYRKQRLAGDRA